MLLKHKHTKHCTNKMFQPQTELHPNTISHRTAQPRTHTIQDAPTNQVLQAAAQKLKSTHLPVTPHIFISIQM
jgi:hypothetical protein